jgi:peptidoglycan/xylan/chitin deacetylase (PgdA/CDA1 family)
MKTGQIFVLAIVVLLPMSGCFGNIQLCSQPAENGVAISFDDKMNIISWNESIPFLSEHEIVATFYVDRWHKLSNEEISILHKLQNLGHEIGIHTMNHSNYYDFKERGGTPEEYLNIEVLPAIEIAEGLGFEISTFSYPNGARDSEIDEILLEHFTVLRGISSPIEGVQPWSTACEDGNVFRSISPTTSDGKNVDQIIETILKSEKTILIYAHGIETGSLAVSFDVLEEFVNAVNQSDKSWLQMRQLA